MNRLEELGLLAAYCLGIERDGRLHTDHGEELEQMVWHHVAQRARCFVEATATLDANRLGRSDLHVIDMVAVPERLEDAVGKAKHQNVLYRFLAQEMIDSIDLVFGEKLEDPRVKRLRGSKVVTEGFFDDHPPPRSPGWLSEPRATKLLDHWIEKPVGGRQIEEYVGDMVLLRSLGQQPLEMAEGLRLGKVSPHIAHALRKPPPRFSVDCRRLRHRLHHAGQALAPLLGGAVVVIDADDGELVRKLAGSRQMVERRNNQTLGEIAASTEDDQRRRWRLTTGTDLCRGRCCFGSVRCERTHPTTR